MLLPCARGAWPILHRVTHQSTAHSIPVYLTTQHRPISHPWFRRGSGGLVHSFPVVVNVDCGCKVIPINTQQIGKMWGGKSLPFLLVSERPFLCRCSECVCGDEENNGPWRREPLPESPWRWSKSDDIAMIVLTDTMLLSLSQEQQQ